MNDNGLKEKTELKSLSMLKKKIDLKVISEKEALAQLANKAHEADYAMSLVMIVMTMENIVISNNKGDANQAASTNVDLVQDARPVVENVVSNPFSDEEVREVLNDTVDNIVQSAEPNVRQDIIDVLRPSTSNKKIDNLRDILDARATTLYGVGMPERIPVPGISRPEIQTKYGVGMPECRPISKPPLQTLYGVGMECRPISEPALQTKYGVENGHMICLTEDGHLYHLKKRDLVDQKENEKQVPAAHQTKQRDL